MTRQELQERLVNFAVLMVKISESLIKTKAGNHLSGQIARSGTSPALNYGEAQDAESHKDFIHKMKVVLKELRESLAALEIIHRAKLYKPEVKISVALRECNELVAIFVKSIETAKSNEEKKQNRESRE